EDEGGAVSVMYIEIDNRDALDAALLQHPHRNRDVVERTEALAVIGERVVQTAPNMNGDVRTGCDQPGADTAADHQPEAVDDLRRPRQLELGEVFDVHGAVAQLGEILWRMHQGQVFPARWLGLDDVGRLNHARPDQTGVNALVLVGRKNVQPDIDAISG